MSSPIENHAALCERLKACDVRPTPQREVVLKVILEKRDHPTADEVFARVKASMPTISLATVYNCLETLVQCGIVRQVNLHEHAHFHDETTGQIYDVDLPPELIARLHEVLPPGFNANVIELTFRGSSAEPRLEPAEGSRRPAASTHGTN